MTVNQPSRFQKQNAVPACIIAGRNLNWLSCTSYAFAMATDQGSAQRVRLTGCDFRDATNDTVGGTTIPQNTPLAEAHGVHVEEHVGANVCSPSYAAIQCRSGRGFVLQGNSGAMTDTKFRSTGTGVNHAVFVSQVRGGNFGSPAEALVYDPAADGRSAGWGKAAKGPQWWPWSLVLEFAAKLRPWGDNDPRVLGPGKFYCAIFPDTVPHFHSKHGGVKTPKFPDKTRIDATGVYGHSRPSLGAAYRTRQLPKDSAWWAYQHVTVDGVEWYGNHSGTEWVRKSKLRQIGGAT